MNKTKSFLVAAGVSLALAFTLSCSSDDGGDNTGGNSNSSGGGGSSSSDGTNGGGQGHFNPDINYGSLTDPRDSKTYRTVIIGTQTWMAQNLNYDVPNNTTDACYNNEPGNCATYGRMYNWATAMGLEQSCNSGTCANQENHQGICPDNWHIPSDAEWEVLVKYVDPNWASSNTNVAGTKLKAKSGWNAHETFGNGTDDYGFSALPGGEVEAGSFKDVGENAYWWSSTDNGNGLRVNLWRTYYNRSNVSSDGKDKTRLYSVRCLKNGN